MPDPVYTLGHSNHPIERFLELLRQHGITAVGDVRSAPYSAWNPQFDREALKASLKARGIEYVFLGKELGARSDDPTCYLYGKVQYDRLARTALFQEGLKRVQQGSTSFRLALMCAEKEPLECHRTILVSRQLVALGMEVIHIHADGHLEPHAEAISRLARTLHLREQDMFRSAEALLDDIYRAQQERIAYDSAEGDPERQRTA